MHLLRIHVCIHDACMYLLCSRDSLFVNESFMNLLCIYYASMYASVRHSCICESILGISVAFCHAPDMHLLCVCMTCCAFMHASVMHPCIRYEPVIHWRCLWCITHASVMHLSSIHAYIGYAFGYLFYIHNACV